jgi:hypothetical protein
MKQRNRGQILTRGKDRFLLRVFVGFVDGKRKYLNETFYGSEHDARLRLKQLLDQQAEWKSKGFLMVPIQTKKSPF